MTVNYTDGGTLKCSKIVIAGDSLYCDDYYTVRLDEVESITDEEVNCLVSMDEEVVGKLVDPGCADCLCRVCARNECTDNYSETCDHDCLGCNRCTGPVVLEDDCPREEFVPDGDNLEEKEE